MPWVMIVDTSATTARLCESALATSVDKCSRALADIRVNPWLTRPHGGFAVKNSSSPAPRSNRHGRTFTGRIDAASKTALAAEAGNGRAQARSSQSGAAEPKGGGAARARRERRTK